MKKSSTPLVEVDNLLRFTEEVQTGELTLIGKGFSSTVYGSENHVVKVLSKEYSTRRAADEDADILYGEQEEIRGFLRPKNIAIARFVVGVTDEGHYKITLIQPRVDGITIAAAQRLQCNIGDISAYFTDALAMHTHTRRMPDLACVERAFNPLDDPNTQVVVSEEAATPVLVDTTFGRTQRRAYLGKFIHAGIARGVRRALSELG